MQRLAHAARKTRQRIHDVHAGVRDACTRLELGEDRDPAITDPGKQRRDARLVDRGADGLGPRERLEPGATVHDRPAVPSAEDERVAPCKERSGRLARIFRERLGPEQLPPMPARDRGEPTGVARQTIVDRDVDPRQAEPALEITQQAVGTRHECPEPRLAGIEIEELAHVRTVERDAECHLEDHGSRRFLTT